MTRKPQLDMQRTMNVERIIDAPLSLVYEAWTNQEHIGGWWGPRGFKTTTLEMNVEVGGVWRYIMHGPNGIDYPNRITYITVQPEKLLVYTHGDDIDNDPNAFLGVVEFEALNEKTCVRLSGEFKTVEQYKAVIEQYGALEGGKQNLQRFEEHVLAQKGFSISRIFNASQDLLFDVWTDPNHLSKWFAPKGFQTIYKEANIRKGGRAHYCMKGEDGHSMWGIAEYKELERPYRLVYHQFFSDENGTVQPAPMIENWPIEMQTVITFEHEGQNQTKLTIRWNPIHATEPQANMFNTMKDSMTQGWTGTFELLESYIPTL